MGREARIASVNTKAGSCLRNRGRSCQERDKALRNKTGGFRPSTRHPLAPATLWAKRSRTHQLLGRDVALAFLVHGPEEHLEPLGRRAIALHRLNEVVVDAADTVVDIDVEYLVDQVGLCVSGAC